MDSWLEAENARIAGIPAYQEALRKTEADFFAFVAQEVKARYPDFIALYLYGSRSENTARRNSDWDFLIRLPSRDRFLEAVYDAGERKLRKRTVDFQFSYEAPSGADFEHAMRIIKNTDA